jgi:hypothetical protein
MGIAAFGVVFFTAALTLMFCFEKWLLGGKK